MPAHQCRHARRKPAPAGRVAMTSGLAPPPARCAATTRARRQVDLASRHHARRAGRGYDTRSGISRRRGHAGDARAFAGMGVRIEAPQASERIVHGVGLHGLRSPQAAIDCGNAGTGMRLLTGLLAGQAIRFGPDRRRIPVAPADAARDRAARSHGCENNRTRRRRAAVADFWKGALGGIEYALPVASAQVKSAILLAGLYAAGETCVREPHPTRDYTERMLAAFGWPIAYGVGWARLEGGKRLQAIDIAVPVIFPRQLFFWSLRA